MGLLQLICVAYTAVIVVPMVWLFTSAFKDSISFFTKPFNIPQVWKYENFIAAWNAFHVARYFANSFFITIISVFSIILLSAMGTFAITRLRFKGSRFVLFIFVGGLLLPRSMLMIPLFILLQQMHILDSYAGLIPVYIAFSFPFTVFVLVPFFNNIPDELEEATFLDGGNWMDIFWRIALPLAKSGLIVAGIFNIFGIWNEYVLALVLLSSDELKTLPLGVADMLLKQHYTANYGVLFAALTVAVLPVLIVYIIFQRKLTGGLMVGALKE